MGRELVVADAVALAELLERLRAAGAPSTIVMIDGQLVPPNAPPPAAWSDVRLKTPAGTFALKRRGDAVAVVAFGNADAPALAMQSELAAALSPRR
jgi:hypothetical protein